MHFVLFRGMEKKEQSVVIIGAGGAGFIAALTASLNGASVVVLEKNKRPGIKIRISGGGKCNVTHEGTPDEILAAFSPYQRRFLKPALFRFPGEAIIQLLADEGVPTFARENGRVFPVSGRADDVVDALLRILKRRGVEVRTNAGVHGILSDASCVSGVAVDGASLAARAVLVATGGMSYRKTGTTGDGLAWARAVGHTIVPLMPALAPIGVAPPLPPSWRGIALRNGTLFIVEGTRHVKRCTGDLLFTHEGISGPAALDCSHAAAACGNASVVWDFLPGMDATEVDALLQKRIVKERGRIIQTLLFDLLPNRIVPDLLSMIGVPPETRGYVLSASQRKSIVRMLKHWTIGNVSSVNIDRGEVTAGGIALSEVDRHTMQSKIIRGLYFAGEILDVDGPIGGYNLQAAFSTGAVAGDHLGHHVELP